jgi:hypothetical protein
LSDIEAELLVGALAPDGSNERSAIGVRASKVDQHEIVGAGLPQSSSHSGFSGAIHKDASFHQCFRPNFAASVITVQ